MNNDDKLMLLDLYYEMVDVVLFDNNDMNLDDDYVNIQLVHLNKFYMNDNHVYVYNNVHQH
jgi:hypothetical protein